MGGKWPEPSNHSVTTRPPASRYRSSTMRIWATIGCGGKTSSPGQPGTTPRRPSVPSSHADPSAITTSAVPCVHRTGGLGERLTMRDQSQ